VVEVALAVDKEVDYMEVDLVEEAFVVGHMNLELVVVGYIDSVEPVVVDCKDLVFEAVVVDYMVLVEVVADYIVLLVLLEVVDYIVLEVDFVEIVVDYIDFVVVVDYNILVEHYFDHIVGIEEVVDYMQDYIDFEEVVVHIVLGEVADYNFVVEVVDMEEDIDLVVVLVDNIVLVVVDYIGSDFEEVVVHMFAHIYYYCLNSFFIINYQICI
jgi:hypothetical protein